jgi:hypothetical protein
MVANTIAVSSRNPIASMGRGEAIEPSIIRRLEQARGLRKRMGHLNASAMDIVTQILLLSDAAILALIGASCLLLAGLFALMDWRRNRLRSIDRLEQVGWMPWTGLFLMFAIVGVMLVALALPRLATP